MQTSKAAVFSQSGHPMELIDLPIPPLKSHEILVRNEMVALCRSDLATYSGKRIEPSPTILGHEIVGRIADFGPGSSRHDLRGDLMQIGDRITWAIFASDPCSDMSKRGMPQKGPDRFKYGHEQLTIEKTLHGGLAQHMILRAHTPVIKISMEVPLPVAAVVNCAVATVAGAVRIAGPLSEKRVLVSGAGMLGVLACAMARRHGARRVGAVDIDEDRLRTAKTFGADFTVALPTIEREEAIRLPDLDTVDVVIEASGVPWSMEKTLEKLDVGGIAVWIGAVHPTRSVAVDSERLVRNLISIRGLHNYNVDDFLEAVRFVETDHSSLPVRELIEDRFELDQIDDAFAFAMKSKAFRVGVRL